jgi:hypothetical protein
MKLSVEDKANDGFGHDVPLAPQAGRFIIGSAHPCGRRNSHSERRYRERGYQHRGWLVRAEFDGDPTASEAGSAYAAGHDRNFMMKNKWTGA